jgi:hypothetical protein
MIQHVGHAWAIETKKIGKRMQRLQECMQKKGKLSEAEALFP